MAQESKYFDRELSWLEFNQRVLDEALNDDVPLLERLKFLSITASNLDEFFRVRIGALKRLISGGVSSRAPSGLTPRQQLQAAKSRIAVMVADQYRCFSETLVPRMADAGIVRLEPERLNATQNVAVRQSFQEEILSVLTPMAIEPEEVFPLLPNQMLNVAIRLAPVKEAPPDRSAGADRYAIIPCGRTLPRFLSVPTDSGFAYMLLEDVVILSVNLFFPNDEILECVPFRLTRNAEVEVEELTPHGLAESMAEVLLARTQADCVRIEIDERASAEMVQFLVGQLEVSEKDVDRLPGPLDLGDFMSLATRRGFEELQYKPWPAVNSPEVPLEEKMFDILAERDVFLYHPYESFEPVVRLIEEAAEDPDVIAIKQTLYRISRNSPIVAALKRGVENGKHVTVLLELKARFDEERNLKQAREMEAIGAQVILGVKGLKTHAKVCIIVRREPHGIQRYLHFGTGNYNESTAKLYSDASLFTSNDDFGADAIAFFNSISGYSQPPQSYRHLESAPLRLRDTLKSLIEAEAERARSGQQARILVKLNALTDIPLIDALYAASQAGVDILLNIRGICCLKPGVEGLSERVRVVSIVDRYLEHARMLYFHHGGDPKLFISSADWMKRNLDNRKELLVPIEDNDCRDRMVGILESYFQDNVKASVLNPDGSYKHLTPDGHAKFRAQSILYKASREAVQRFKKRRRTIFEPHRTDDIQ